MANARTTSTSLTTGAIVVPGTGGLGLGGNINVGQGVNIGTTLNVGGNVTAANLNVSFANIAANASIAGALFVTGSGAVGGDFTITGNVTGGGIRKTQSTTPPVNPVVGDLWYKTDTDVYYQYTSDGVNKYWIDYVGATVSNAAISTGTGGDFTITKIGRAHV